MRTNAHLCDTLKSNHSLQDNKIQQSNSFTTYQDVTGIPAESHAGFLLAWFLQQGSSLPQCSSLPPCWLHMLLSTTQATQRPSNAVHVMLLLSMCSKAYAAFRATHVCAAVQLSSCLAAMLSCCVLYLSCTSSCGQILLCS